MKSLAHTAERIIRDSQRYPASCRYQRLQELNGWISSLRRQLVNYEGVLDPDDKAFRPTVEAMSDLLWQMRQVHEARADLLRTLERRVSTESEHTPPTAA